MTEECAGSAQDAMLIVYLGTGGSGVHEELSRRIEDKSALIGVIGLGYVGLPLAEVFARRGYKVLGFDISPQRVERINRGENYIGDIDDASLLTQVQEERLSATTDMSRLSECDCLSICVPTPLGKTREPDISYIQSVVAELERYLRAGQLVVLESTTFPGTTEEVIAIELHRSRPDLEPGRDFFLAFSPERVDPGNVKYKTENTPKVVGGMTPQCTELARLLYSKVIEHVHTVSSTKAAEMVKLLENTYRNINIAWANEFAMMCRLLGVDVWEVIEAAKTKPFGFQPFYPGPGLGGHCIPIDPLYLAWKMRALNFPSRMIENADNINTAMPAYVVRLVGDALNEASKPIRGSHILCLGVAYKADVNDTRESPAIDIILELQRRGAIVSYHDPYVPQMRIGEQVFTSQPLTEAALAGADLALILADHGSVDYALIERSAPLILDTRNALKRSSGKIIRL
jgi:UDP-N-acetyl-D-glucosamine dehydrogenase